MALRLIIENLDGVTTMVPLSEAAVTIGRTSENTIQLSEQNVSRRHATMKGGPEGWLIEDQSSYNGVLVNGVSIAEPTTLREGDLIQIGDYHLVLTDSSDKQTLDLQRPRRSLAQEEPMLASSSSDLPQLSPSEIAVLTGEAQALEQVERDRKFPWMAVAIAVLCIAAMAVAAMQWSRRSETEAPAQPKAEHAPVQENAPVAVAPVAMQKAAFPTAVEVEEFPLAELLTGTTGDPDDAEPADSPRTRSRRGSSRRRNRSPAERSETPVQDARIVLRRAQSAAAAGKPGRAYDLAEKAYALHATDDALFVMGKAACQLRQKSKAIRAMRKLDERRQPELVSACENLGVEL